MTTIRSRSAWTSAPNARIGRPLDPTVVTALTIHYPADGAVTLCGLTEDDVAQRLRAYRDHHISANGWLDIGYNYAIDGSGRIWDLTGDHVGAHAGPAGNPTSIGVLLLVGDEESPSPAMVASFTDLRAAKLAQYPRAVNVQGHQQVRGASTACPGPTLMTLINSGTLTGRPRSLRQRIAQLLHTTKRRPGSE